MWRSRSIARGRCRSTAPLGPLATLPAHPIHWLPRCRSRRMRWVSASPPTARSRQAGWGGQANRKTIRTFAHHGCVCVCMLYVPAHCAAGAALRDMTPQALQRIVRQYLQTSAAAAASFHGCRFGAGEEAGTVPNASCRAPAPAYVAMTGACLEGATIASGGTCTAQCSAGYVPSQVRAQRHRAERCGGVGASSGPAGEQRCVPACHLCSLAGHAGV